MSAPMTQDELRAADFSVMAPGPETDPTRWTMAPPNARGRVEYAETEAAAWALAQAWYAEHF